ncbi:MULTISPECIES: hypothetical protein [Actinoplanes]|uniref:hypothetical protein n=1 Tax=Actinoplanes TaxID=1865 RepID=UPI000ABC370F|nr:MULTISPECIES: hypothetical protein [Actinoplanes]
MRAPEIKQNPRRRDKADPARIQRAALDLLREDLVNLSKNADPGDRDDIQKALKELKTHYKWNYEAISYARSEEEHRRTKTYRIFARMRSGARLLRGENRHHGKYGRLLIGSSQHYGHGKYHLLETLRSGIKLESLLSQGKLPGTADFLRGDFLRRPNQIYGGAPQTSDGFQATQGQERRSGASPQGALLLSGMGMQLPDASPKRPVYPGPMAESAALTGSVHRTARQREQQLPSPVAAPSIPPARGRRSQSAL